MKHISLRAFEAHELYKRGSVQIRRAIKVSNCRFLGNVIRGRKKPSKEERYDPSLWGKIVSKNADHYYVLDQKAAGPTFFALPCGFAKLGEVYACREPYRRDPVTGIVEYYSDYPELWRVKGAAGRWGCRNPRYMKASEARCIARCVGIRPERLQEVGAPPPGWDGYVQDKMPYLWNTNPWVWVLDFVCC